MKEVDYIIGVRTERIIGGAYLGIGITWYTEKALVISFFGYDIYIGSVYSDD